MSVAQRVDERVIAQAKGRRLSDIVSRTVELKKAGNQWMGRCPFHEEKTPSFFVSDRRGTFKCYGCGKQGDAIDFITQSRGVDFQHAINELTSGAAYRSAPSEFERRIREASKEYAEAGSRRFASDEDERARTHEARAIWANRKPLRGTVAERYLTEVRGLRGPWAPTLGFAPALYFAPARREMPALLAAMQDGGGYVTAVQRIFLDQSTGRKAEPAKQAKRTKGPMHDGAVRLSKPGRVLGLAGSVEDALSAKRLFSLPVWATCGENRLGSIALPECVEQVIIFADADEAGMREAIKAADEYERRGLAAVIEAPEGVKDWNEFVQLRARACVA